MNTIMKRGVTYKRTFTMVRKRIYKEENNALNAGTPFEVLESKQNAGAKVMHAGSGKVHPLAVAYEGTNYYHLGATVPHAGEMDMVLKKDYLLL